HPLEDGFGRGEVDPDEAAAGGTEWRAAVDHHLPVPADVIDRIFDMERGDVEPAQVGRLGQVMPYGGHSSGEDVTDPAPVAVEHPDQRVLPFLAVLPCGQRRDHPWYRDRAVEVRRFGVPTSQ